MRRIYLDHNASTPLRSEVVSTMADLLRQAYGNPSSLHWAGTAAKSVLDTARGQVATRIGADSDEIVFTSGGSEANNHALKGAWFSRPAGRHKFVASAIEHPSVMEPLRFLERLGAEIELIGVDSRGMIDLTALQRAIDPQTIMVSVMHANNEVGTIQPIAQCAALAHAQGALMHTDAAQSLGKIGTRVDDLGCDLLSIAGHKLGAPKGIGALYIRRNVRLESLVHGAGHEAGRRAGTESALLAAALGMACELADPVPSIATLGAQFLQSLETRFGAKVQLNGHREQRLPNTLNISFIGKTGVDVLAGLEGVAASTGSACHAGELSISPTLAAMGVPVPIARGAVRFSLGHETSAEDIEETLRLLDQMLQAQV